MQSYQRIVSYLYRYTKEGKADNTGHVRVEKRDGQLRLSFRIRDLRMMDQRQLTVCFYFHEKEQIRPVFVDTFLCDRGNCEYKKSHPEEHFRLENMKGVLIFDGEELLYGSGWDEREIRKDRIWTADSGQVKRGAPAEQEEPEEAAEELLEQAVKERENEGESYIQTRRISIEELSSLPTRYWGLAENPFLKQSYGRYGHLLLGNLKMGEGKEIRILGVPGIYENREKYLADVFGFSNFMPEEEGGLLTGKSGYWFLPVAEEW